MASILIRCLDAGLKQQLRLRAAAHDRSMEAEARKFLKSGLCSGKPTGKEFLASIRAIIKPLGGMELGTLPPRQETAPRGLRFVYARKCGPAAQRKMGCQFRALAPQR